MIFILMDKIFPKQNSKEKKEKRWKEKNVFLFGTIVCNNFYDTE